MKFSVAEEIESYTGFMYDFCFNHTNPENNDFLGNYGSHDITDVLNATLVNLGERYAPILERGINWLCHGIEHNEGVGPNHNESIAFHQTNLHISLALGLWLRDNQDDLSLWNRILDFHQQSLLNPDIYPESQMPTAQLADWGMRCLLAQEYEKGIEGYRQYHPADISTKHLHMSEAKLAYAYCLHYAENQFSYDELFSAARKLLNRKMENDWLCKGQTKYATIWLKIVYAHEQADLLPKQILWKAYDHMPKVEKPEFAK